MYKWIYLIGSIIAVVLSFIFIVTNISYGRTDSWLVRAKDAGNPAQVAEFLGNYTDSLISRDLINGRYYSIWKYPATDMVTYLRIIDGLILRAEMLSQQQPDKESYQMGLINLEKDLGDIDARAFSVWVASGGFWLIALVICFGGFLLLGWIEFLS